MEGPVINKPQRIWELDAFRGLCILWVVLVHLSFDFSYFLNTQLHWGPIFTFFQRNGGTMFIILSGCCATLGRHTLRRGAVILGCAMAITAITLGMWLLGMANADLVIWYGILHLLGTCMLLYPLLRRGSTRLLALLSLVMVLAGLILRQLRFPVTWLFPLGVISPEFASGDFFPLLPNLGWFMLGVIIGRTVYAGHVTRFPKAPVQAWPVRFLCACGRKSLWIYLIHQPVLYLFIRILEYFK